MAKGVVAAALIGVAAGIAPIVPAQADDTGLARVLHSLRREAGKLCMTDHFHYGNSQGEPSKKAAEVAAIRAWAGFVAFEYGTDWSKFAKAGSKKMGCTPSGTSWGCSVEARPCK